jgi:hypothetical protein
MFGNGHGGIGGFPPQQRRGVGGRHHSDGSGQPLRPKIILQELAHLASAFADQGEHDHIGTGMPRQHGEQSGLADPRPGEQSQPLALTARREGINCADPKFDARAKARAFRSRGRCGAYRSSRSFRQRPVPVERPAERVKYAADPALGHGKRGRLRNKRGEHRLAGTEPVERPEREHLGNAATESHHFGHDIHAGSGSQKEPVADPEMAGQPPDFDGETGNRSDLAMQPCRRNAGKGDARGGTPCRETAWPGRPNLINHVLISRHDLVKILWTETETSATHGNHRLYIGACHARPACGR